ncbi:CHASE3 domain-containing protein [Ramlibacter sp. XY19]|uniref:sensor histidine kinase n=1 Tax=Ramlibacter paludis TaxID=2908000 RepID=UPI0023DAD9A6|nr:CHASE3 domain-containing protein [Ramlibacter paludis]MCG2594242.1 CHASE3 domain-containing protein [Ramlibacter paludis]
MFQRRRLAIGVGAGLAIGFLALILIVGTTIWLVERGNSLFEQSALQRTIRIVAVDLRDHLRTAESSQRGFLLTGNQIYLAPYDTSKTRARQELDDLGRMIAPDAPNRAMLPRLSEAVAEKIAEMDSTIALKNAGRDAEAMAVLQRNRGKTLMDEINVFLYGAILIADENAALASAEQQRNASLLRWISAGSAVVIVLVVWVVAFTVYRNGQDLKQARDEVRAINLTLEERVKTRTADLALARERAEVLLVEVNHRVANSLQLVSVLVRMQMRSVADPAAKDALAQTQARINAISLIHKSLYTSGDVSNVALDDYLGAMLGNLETAMKKDGHTAILKCYLEPVSLRTDASVSLGVAVQELVTNAFKYAYPDDQPGEVRVRLTRLGEGKAELTVEDDGVGIAPNAKHTGTGLGSKIIQTMAAALQTQVEYISRGRGTAARLVLTTA